MVKNWPANLFLVSSKAHTEKLPSIYQHWMMPGVSLMR